ncbi:FAD:protein FMN transferase [Bradyrhizobium manausense]|uniref:FAD:protein FMN transferase n=1 Tax=Bradyrhizobium manausense TaxID=989370 RepID=UPI001BA8CDE3|nr:FAD:protein FMN transferase [Bradyrhizobium manausense]MBR1088203.1 FAD:protein FMN transferase [Bradyrhizobium manausense]
MKRARPLLGTFVEIEAAGLAERDLERAVNAAFEAIARVHRLMSFHEPDSDVSRLNRNAVSGPVVVDRWTARVLHWARTVFEATGGLFDCAVGYELMQSGVLPSRGLDHVESGTFAAVEHLGDDRFRFSAPIAIDFGGIAKGFAVDRAIAILRARSVREAVVNAGGDMRTIGPAPQTVYIRCPETNTRVVRVGLLRNAAIATSAALATVGKRGGTAGVPAAKLQRCAFSVVAPTCLVADALTKVLIQLGDPAAPCFAAFGATAFITRDDTIEHEAA